MAAYSGHYADNNVQQNNMKQNVRKVKRNISSANPKNLGARNVVLQRPAIFAKNQGPNASMPEL